VLPINTSLVIAAGEGIVMNKYAGSVSMESSMFNLMVKYLLGRMGYVCCEEGKSKVDLRSSV